MCTVVVRWAPEEPSRILALRDELTTREFDDPGRWWPEYPDVVAGRDRQAGGTWCASRVGTGVTALVLNRPQKRLADPGAPSRGVLPLLGVAYEGDWARHVELAGMASFALALVTPERLALWVYDGAALTATDLPAGVHMVTSGGAEDGKAERYLPDFTRASFPDGWQQVIRRSPPRDEPASLTVRHEADGKVFGTVFGQLIEARPGRVRLQHSHTPWTDAPWRVATG